MKQWKDLLTNFDLEAIVRMVIVRKNFGDPSRLSRLRPFQARLEISEVNLLEIMFCEKIPCHVVVQMEVICVPEMRLYAYCQNTKLLIRGKICI